MEHRESQLFLALVGDQSFAIELVLDAHEGPIGRTEIHQHPRAHASKLGNLVKHRQLMAIDVGLILLSPSFVFTAVQTGLGVGTEFADDQRLLVSDPPVGYYLRFRDGLHTIRCIR